MDTSKSKIVNPKSKISLGFSPCPNDTYIFDAMVHGKIDTEGLSFQYFLDDVETLNRQAFLEEYDITKLSYAAYPFVSGQYQLLNSGSALGFKCGPILISKKELKLSDINKCSVAIPGRHTTANFLFCMVFPDAANKKEMLFSDIEDAVLNEKVDAGVIIHENRFTYMHKGLLKLIDLGEFWEEQTKMPIPLGGIAVRRNFPEELKLKIDRIIKRSVEFANANPFTGFDFIKEHAQEMNDEVRYKHIELYVNKYTVDLGEEGRTAVNTMFEKAAEKNIIAGIDVDIFV